MIEKTLSVLINLFNKKKRKDNSCLKLIYPIEEEKNESEMLLNINTKKHVEIYQEDNVRSCSYDDKALRNDEKSSSFISRRCCVLFNDAAVS